MKNLELINIWNDLTDFTYIYGYENNVIETISEKLPKPLEKDEYGNFYIQIGDSKTLFISHLDTVGKQKLKVNKIKYKEDGKNFVKTDGNTILGADDKTGVVIMLNMIDNNVPGFYYFMIGEEVGTIGSGLIYKEKSESLTSFDRCISFDRKGYGSIINRQMGEYCCSNEFVDGLSDEFSKYGMEYKSDPFGSWTDSALFMGYISECTNISVGYFNEHKTTEKQDIDYMLQLADVATKVNWETLPKVRLPETFDSENPKEIKNEDNHLPLYKLRNLFDKIDDLIYDNIDMYSNNINFFEPGKEMKYFQMKDLKGVNKFSLILNWDGSIIIFRNGKEFIFNNFEELKNKINDLKSLLNIEDVNEKLVLNYNQFIRKIK